LRTLGETVPRASLGGGERRHQRVHQDPGAIIADFDNDGLKDIFCPEGAALGTQATRSELYLHQPGHTFVDRAARYGVFQPFARGRSGTFVKANGDAYPDLFAANDENRVDDLPSPNRLIINQAGSAYRHAPEFGLEHEVGYGAATGEPRRERRRTAGHLRDAG
jgi:hypothetical protein